MNNLSVCAGIWTTCCLSKHGPTFFKLLGGEPTSILQFKRVSKKLCKTSFAQHFICNAWVDAVCLWSSLSLRKFTLTCWKLMTTQYWWNISTLFYSCRHWTKCEVVFHKLVGARPHLCKRFIVWLSLSWISRLSKIGIFRFLPVKFWQFAFYQKKEEEEEKDAGTVSVTVPSSTVPQRQ